MIHRRLTDLVTISIREGIVAINKEESGGTTTLCIDKTEAIRLIEAVYDEGFLETPTSIWTLIHNTRKQINPDPIVSVDVPSVNQVNVYLKSGLKFTDVLFFNSVLRRRLSSATKVTYILNHVDLGKAYVRPNGDLGCVQLLMDEELAIK